MVMYNACTLPRSGDFFFFQAEDGIRDKLVTGVQTCALPIYDLLRARDVTLGGDVVDRLPGRRDRHDHRRRRRTEMDVPGAPHRRQVGPGDVPARTALDPLLLEVAHRAGHGELPRHLAVPHEPP